MRSGSIEQRASFELIRYANCWEDADILCEALRPSEGKRFLSIASGGDNSLALLAEGADVVAADLSSSQLALVELKTAAIRELDYEEALAFLGVRESIERRTIFADLRDSLSDGTREYWDGHGAEIGRGVVKHRKRRTALPAPQVRQVRGCLQAFCCARREGRGTSGRFR